MTTAPGHSALTHATPPPAPVVASTIHVEWLLSIDALRAARPDLAASPGMAPRARVASLIWTITPGGEASASLLIDGRPLDFPLVPTGLGADVTLDEPTRTLHARVPGLLELVLDCPGDDHEARRPGAPLALLYARTTLFGAIGLPGGSYRLIPSRPAN